MLYKVSPFGYFGRVKKISRGPWFQEHKVEEDGLEYYYQFIDGDKTMNILSNNIPFEDRERLQYYYYALERNRGLAWAAGLYLGFETVLRVPYFKKMAIGWRMYFIFQNQNKFKNLLL